MKVKSIIILIGFIILSITCDEPKDGDVDTIVFFKTFGENYTSDYGFSLQQTTDGGYIITGYTLSSGNGRDVWLIKTDSTGIEEWNQTFGGGEVDEGFSVQQTTDGGYIINGYTQSYGNGEGDDWLIKTNSNGIEEWNKTYGESDRDRGYAVQQTTDGGYIIIYSIGNFGDSYDIMLVKTDYKGDVEWSKIYGDSISGVGQSVQQTNDGGYIITGSKTLLVNNEDYYSGVWLIKTDNGGNEEWSQSFGGNSCCNSGHSVQQTTDGGYIIIGKTVLFGNGSYDVWLIKTDSNGNEEWNNNFGGSSHDIGWSVQQTTDGGYIITGETLSFGNGSYDVWLIKTDSNGNEEWNKTFGGTGSDEGRFVQQTNDWGYIITGSIYVSGKGEEVLLIKTDSEGNTEPYGE